jgi:ABC-2 type transport system permease protein
MLAISTLALFWFGWAGVWVTRLTERQFQQMVEAYADDEEPGSESGTSENGSASSESGGDDRKADTRESLERRGFQVRSRFLRAMAGQGATINSAVIEMQFWIHPFVWLPIIVWSISRGSQAVAGEVERGAMDLVLSRPLTRWSYWMANVVAGVIGVLAIPASLLAGHFAGARFNSLAEPPSFGLLLRPALSQAGLGLAIFGVAIVLSGIDRVRWRPIMIATGYVIASFAAWVIGLLPVLEDTGWRPFLQNSSLFTAYNPVEAVSNYEDWARHAAILWCLGAVASIFGFAGFARRDLPTNS